MSYSSPPRSYSPLKSKSSEEIQAYPLLNSTPSGTPPLVTSESLHTLVRSLRQFSCSPTAAREALDSLCKELVQIAARASDLPSASLRSLLHQIEECRELVNEHHNSDIQALAPEFARFGVFQDALSLALEQQVSNELASTSAKSSETVQEISDLKSAVVQLTGCVQHMMMGDSGSKQRKMFGNTMMNQDSPGNFLDCPYNGGGDWGQMQQAPSRELSLTRVHQNSSNHSQQHSQVTPHSLIDGLNGEQLKLLAVQGLMQQLSPQPAYPPPVPQVNVHNMISTDAHAAAATEQNNTQESHIVTKVKNTLKQARSNLIPLLIGGAAAMLLHNHLPVLKHLSPGGGGRARRFREDAQKERSRTRRTAATAEEALEECHESMREWREYSRRARGPFNHVPEPSGKCDLRALRARVMRSAAGSGENSRASGQGHDSDESSVEGSVWRSLLP